MKRKLIGGFTNKKIINQNQAVPSKDDRVFQAPNLMPRQFQEIVYVSLIRRNVVRLPQFQIV
ncbi:hypothetical protein MXAZACID_05016 [Acidocella sp. MX-AZ02]|nr:hypothetical protein MXAZACID_05016 [Acidocella sp. MX-AZ02]